MLHLYLYILLLIQPIEIYDFIIWKESNVAIIHEEIKLAFNVEDVCDIVATKKRTISDPL